MAHITGGGLLENIPRVLPENAQAIIDAQNWRLPAIFQWLQQNGHVEDSEMFRTFNCGVGMVLMVDKDDADNIISTLKQSGENAWRLGHVETDVIRSANNEQVIFKL
jgi:phosphoribosylformylglycinamidine cyclo-ligase